MNPQQTHFNVIMFFQSLWPNLSTHGHLYRNTALEADQVHCAASAEFAGATFVDRPAAERIHSEGDPGTTVTSVGEVGTSGCDEQQLELVDLEMID